MLRTVLAFVLAVTAVPALADGEKEESCGFQAEVMKAVQQARLDDVPQEDVPEKILETDPAWPDNFDNAIPSLAEWVYQQEIGVVRKHDLSEPFREMCITNWDTTQQMLGK